MLFIHNNFCNLFINLFHDFVFLTFPFIFIFDRIYFIVVNKKKKNEHPITIICNMFIKYFGVSPETLYIYLFVLVHIIFIFYGSKNTFSVCFLCLYCLVFYLLLFSIRFIIHHYFWIYDHFNSQYVEKRS